MRHWQIEAKVGLFAAIILIIVAFSTIRISEGPLFFGGGYTVSVVVESALGIDNKTKVEIAGIRVGQIEGVRLAEDGRRAIVTIHIDRSDLRLPEGTKAVVRAKGFLGDTFVELVPGDSADHIAPGGTLAFGGVGGDVNMMISRFNEIADDMKVVSGVIREMIEAEDAPIRSTVANMEQFTKTMKDLVERNERNINRITENFAVLSEQLRSTVAEARRDAVESFSNVASITRKIDEGEGTVGRLINDESTVNKVNDTLDSVNEAIGGFRTLETELGYHSEFLGSTKDFKHYIHFDLWPRPDQAFLFEFVEDRSPSANRVTRTTTVTSGAATSTVTADTETVERNRFRVSAQLAKKLYDFTLRGGIIESRGGVGLDYDKGPVRLSASAFDFNTQQGNKPHLKLAGTVRVTPAIYLTGGADDPLNPNQKTDWFVGAGLRLRDDDIKSLLSAGGLGAALRR
ncbi:MAG: MCE family protein [Deltaproteobacteria bacterium]|nr:MCE family protein [Deltaproteobacteria bacterium]